MTKALIISADYSLRKVLGASLEHSGFIVQSADHSKDAWKHLSEIAFDLLILDFQLSTDSSLEFYKSIRHQGLNIPVLMIGEGDFDEFMLKDLSPFHYAYILKPLKPSELKLKINRLLSQDNRRQRPFKIGELKIDVARGLIYLKDKIYYLGKMETILLMMLARKKGAIVKLNKIRKLFEMQEGFSQLSTIYYVNNLRNKLSLVGGDAFQISLIKNQGYRFDMKVAE